MGKVMDVNAGTGSGNVHGLRVGFGHGSDMTCRMVCACMCVAGAKQKQTQSTSRSLPPLLAAAFAAQQAAARQADNGDAHEPNTDEQQMDVPRVTSARGKRNRRASLVSTAYTAQVRTGI